MTAALLMIIASLVAILACVAVAAVWLARYALKRKREFEERIHGLLIAYLRGRVADAERRLAEAKAAAPKPTVEELREIRDSLHAQKTGTPAQATDAAPQDGDAP